MFAVPNGPIWTAVLASGQQMTMALDETLRLKTARVVKAFENPLEKTRSPLVGNRCGCSSYPRN
jgi:hypothetical protein